MLALRNIHIERNQKPLITEVNWTFTQGAITAIRKTGVLDGSSTLLKCCAGIEPVSNGEISWQGQNVLHMPEADVFSTLNYCYERGGLISLFTVYNNIAMPITYHNIYGAEDVHTRIHTVATELNIEDLLELEPHQINDVQCRLVNLMRGLVLNADVILVDEIQTGMSAIMLQRVIDVLQRYVKQGGCVVMVTTLGDDDSFADYHLSISNQTLEVCR